MSQIQAEGTALVQLALEEVFDHGNVDAIDDLFAEAFEYHTVVLEDTVGREAFKAPARELLAAFGGLQFVVEHTAAEGDLVAIRGEMRGRHVGEFKRLPPTDRDVAWASQGFFRVEDGCIAEAWMLSDAMGLLGQLGVGPGGV